MKILHSLLLFCCCNYVYSVPPSVQYFLNLLPFYSTENPETISLSSELKVYLEGKVVNQPKSENVEKFNMEDLRDFYYCNCWCEKCWNLEKIELEQILYKFYVNEVCPYEKNVLLFLRFCLSTYNHKKEEEYPLNLKILKVIHDENLRLNKIYTTM